MECQTKADFGAFIPSQLDDYPLDPFEFRIYARIVRRAGNNGCFESLPKMAAGCGMSLSRARTAVRLLAKAGFIELVDRASKGLSNLCWITSPTSWVNPELVEKIRKSLARSKNDTPIESDTTPLSKTIPEGNPYKESKLNYSNEGGAPPPKNEIEVEILDPEPVPNAKAVGQRILPDRFRDESYFQENKQSYSGEQTNPDQDHFSAAEPENLKILALAQAIAYDWHKRPWMLNAIEFKPEISTSVWMSNTDFYSLPNGSPNYKKINDRLKKLDNGLKGIGKQAAIAYVELTNYWKTASSLINPGGGVNAEQYKSVAKQVQTQTKRDSRLAEMDAALKNY